ncbi:MAG: type II toxin-antitoxin system VapC family toxin [Thermoplasmatota archaeon]
MSGGRTVVVLDANALMMPFQFSINLDAELSRVLPGCEAVVPSTVVEELERLASGSGGREARAALGLARRYRVVEAEGRGDGAVLGVALRLRAALLTNDARLRRRAQEAGLRVICMRERSHLEMF